MHFSAHQFSRVLTAITAAVYTGTHSGPAMDTLGFREALIHFNIGVPASVTDPACALTIQESVSTTSASFAAITGASITATTLIDNTTYVIGIDLEGRKRYIRAQIICAAGTNWAVGATMDLMHAINLPVSQVNTAIRV